MVATGPIPRWSLRICVRCVTETRNLFVYLCMQVSAKTGLEARASYCLARPQCEDMPSHSTKFPALNSISLHILADLQFPKQRVSRRQFRSGTAFMPMPKTPIHENRKFNIWQNDIWGARQLFLMSLRPKSNLL